MMSFVNTSQVLKGISVEHLRHFLSINNYQDLLKKTYSEKFEEIPNLNTEKLWDLLNSEISLSHIRKNNPIALNRLKIISSWIKKRGCKRILDCRFGSGCLEELMIGNLNPNNWYGVDTSRKSISRIKKALKSANYKYGSILDIPFEDKMFDCVVIQEVIEHISPSKTFKAYSEVYRVLKPGGYLIVTTPINEDLENMLFKNLNPNAHVRIYSETVINFEIIKSGFKILETKRLTAFKNLYKLKKILNKIFNKWKPNNILVLAQK